MVTGCRVYNPRAVYIAHFIQTTHFRKTTMKKILALLLASAFIAPALADDVNDPRISVVGAYSTSLKAAEVPPPAVGEEVTPANDHAALLDYLAKDKAADAEARAKAAGSKK